MTSHHETQDEPIMDGATEATVREKSEGKNEQNKGDEAVGSVVDDNLRSIRAVGENRTAESLDGEKTP